MTSQVKQRIEQIRRGEAPEGYKKTKVGIVPEEWEKTTIGKCIIEYVEKTTIENQYPVLTSARAGLMLQSEYYSNHQVTTNDNVGYNVIPRGYITYRSRSDDGRFKFNENTIVDKGIVSYFYPVFSFNSNVSRTFMLSLMNYSIYRQSYSFVEGTAQQVLSIKKLQSLKYCIPPLAEQRKIAEILTTQDKLIQLQQKKIDELKRLKKVCLSKMFPKKGCNVPEVRFPGFTEPWEQRELGKVFTIRNEKNGDRYTRDDVLAVSDTYGCVNQIAFHGRSFAGEDISNYKVVRTGDIIYTKSPLQAKPYGIIKIVGEETGIISPLYVVNETAKGNDPMFMYYLFDTPERTNNYLSPLVRKGAKNTMNISNEEWLSGLVTISPNEQEQRAIGNYFKSLDNLITLHQRKLEEEQKKKKALMQLLLTGIVRVTPFKGVRKEK